MDRDIPMSRQDLACDLPAAVVDRTCDMSSADGVDVAGTSFVGGDADSGTEEMITHASGYSESDPLVEGERTEGGGSATSEHKSE